MRRLVQDIRGCAVRFSVVTNKNPAPFRGQGNTVIIKSKIKNTMEQTIIKIEIVEGGRVRCEIRGATKSLVDMLGSAMEGDPNLSSIMVAAAMAIEMKRIKEEEEILRQAKNN